MTKRELLQSLEELAKQLDVRVRYEKTAARGGLCKHQDKYQIIVDRKASDDVKLSIISTALKTFDLSNLFIPPKLREYLEL